MRFPPIAQRSKSSGAALRRLIACALAVSALLAGGSANTAELIDGDRVALVGNTFIDREQQFGYVEALLTARLPGRRITFRNLGWDGDTVFEQQRPEGFGTLESHLARLRPTVMLVCYGLLESRDGEPRLPAFETAYDRMLGKLGASGRRIVLVGTYGFENVPPGVGSLPRRSQRRASTPAAGVSPANKRLAAYVERTRQIAARRGHDWMDLFSLLEAERSAPKRPLTTNGIHLSAYGYWRVAIPIADALTPAAKTWSVSLAAGGAAPVVTGTRLENLRVERRRHTFRLLDEVLPAPPCPGGPAVSLPPLERTLKVAGLAAGRYRLTIDGQTTLEAAADEFARGVNIVGGPEQQQAERLRRRIVEKNALFYYRFRPHNGEYVFGRRAKAEGSNSGNDQFPGEMARLDTLIAAAEGEIAGLAQPKPHEYQIVRLGDDK